MNLELIFLNPKCVPFSSNSTNLSVPREAPIFSFRGNYDILSNVSIKFFMEKIISKLLSPETTSISSIEFSSDILNYLDATSLTEDQKITALKEINITLKYLLSEIAVDMELDKENKKTIYTVNKYNLPKILFDGLRSDIPLKKELEGNFPYALFNELYTKLLSNQHFVDIDDNAWYLTKTNSSLIMNIV